VLAWLSALLVLAAGLGGFSTLHHLRAWRHARAAQQALERRDLAGAYEHLQQCLDDWPNSASNHFLAARTARRLGRYDEAEVHLKRCQQLGWDPKAIQLERYLTSAQRGDFGGGMEGALLDGIHDDPGDSVVILEALCRGYMTRPERARRLMRCLDEWLEQDPDAVQALLWRGQLRFIWGDRAGGQTDYKRVLELEPDNEEANLLLGQELTRSLAPAKAAEHFERVLARQPDNPTALLGLARCRNDLHHPDQAIPLLEALLRQQPRNAAALTERGRAALALGQLDRAEAWLRQAVQLSPDDRVANTVLAECLQGLEPQWGTSLALTTPWVLGYRVLYQLERMAYEARVERMQRDEARMRTLLTQFTKGRTNDPKIYYELGSIYLRLGHPADARKWFETAVNLDPGYEAARQELEKLPAGPGG
jgi:tetratricopeptide (TPR) repeat protein